MLSSLFDSYEYIVLKKDSNDDKQVFGEISEIVSFNDRLIIFDNDVANGLFVYDNSGNFIFSLLNGAGPSEVRGIEDFCIDEENNNVLVLDNGNKTIKLFSLESGEFLNSFPLDHFCQGIAYVGNGNVILSVSEMTAEEIYDGAKLILKNLDQPGAITIPVFVNESNRYLSFGGGGTKFLKTSSEIYFSQAFGNEIFMFSREGGRPLKKLFVDFGANDLRNHAKNITDVESLTKYAAHSNSARLFGMYNSIAKNNLIYMVSNQESFNYLLVSKDLNEYIAYKSIENDLYNLPATFLAGYSNSGEAYTFIDPETIQFYLDQGFELEEPLREKLGDFDILNSNPVIVRLYNK
ncbi:6-bladed beta-propeller protein [Anseongella ginsenosidimutans]|uniref:6-bladed beta-propeller protein n=1 Tax=Anseongella ginsenosidimutans TaxID=496056 RepID=A0A4R3KJ33_9SPHI|nr:6-bladed beta-propeller [Anseongella ginsenosidimutans]QEC52464.1 6-bladed beta-propeller [Anseongella ginsenosidimutans]TCS83676.1 6-bladed beta-propeller protein [Anseongella ginsenosidimutans]